MRIHTTVFFVALVARADAQFGPQQVISTSSDEPLCVRSADLDGDGDFDLFSAGGLQLTNGELAWHENLGGGSFGAAQVLSDPDVSASRVLSADLDGDGDPDLISVTVTWDQWLGVTEGAGWNRNLGGGSFAQHQDLTAGWSATACDARDLDGDGDVDVLLGSWTDARIWWRPNQGGASFGPTQALIDTQLWGLEHVYARDLDGDGDADVLATSSSQDLVVWYENLGGGSFGSQQTITSQADGVRKLAFADLDGDADTDVLSASLGDRKLAWYENLGAGSFGPQALIDTLPVGGPWDVHATDLDGDGDADVLASTSQQVAWYENQGGAAFGPLQTISTAVLSARSVHAEDLDGDGDSDVLSASTADDKVAWYANEMSPGVGYCFGHPGSGTPCPCANDNDGSGHGAGCANGVFASGARLTASGAASTANDTLVLTTTGLQPNQSGLYFQADNRVAGGAGLPFGDGLRCAGGNLVRLQVRFADVAGTSHTTIAIATKGGVLPGETKRYQCWYRNTANPPCGSGVNDFNLSNGYEIVWTL